MKIKQYLTILIVVSLILTMSFFLGIFDSKEEIRKVNSQEIIDNYIDCVNRGECEDLTVEVKKETKKLVNNLENKQEYLKKLAKLESLNGKSRKVLDTNNKYSLGLFHFQAVTVQDMYRRFYNKKISIPEAINIAQNDVLATKLAHDAIFIHGETWHWKISNCKLGLITKNCLTQKQINNLYLAKN